MGDTFIISGHTGDAANLAMNQAYTITTVTSATEVVLSGSGMTIGTYTTGTVIGTSDGTVPGCGSGGDGDKPHMGYCYNPKWKPKTSKEMYNADVSLSGTRFGGTYPEGTLRLKGIAGAEYIPFYVRAATRTKAGWSKSIEISCSPPATAISSQTDVTGQRNVTVTLPRPIEDNGARITKILLRWWSSERILNQVQRITLSPIASPWYIVDTASAERGLHHWYSPIRTTSCGSVLLDGASFHGGYATWGAGTTVR